MTQQQQNRHITTQEFKRVLIIRFSALGDVAITVPVIYSVCSAYPDTKFCIVTRKIASSLFVNAPHNLSVIGLNQENYKGILGCYKLYKEIKSTFNPDTIIDLQADSYTKWFSWYFGWHGVKVKKVDLDFARKKDLTRRVNKKMFPLISSRERYSEVFYRAGFVFNETFKSIFGKDKPNQSVFSEITSPKKIGEKWIAIAPFAKYKEKIYPTHLMKKVIDEVASWKDVKVFLFGGGTEEQKILGEWDNEYDNVTSVAVKRYGFPTELSLLSYCDVMVSMDSANMQLASLVCLPVVSIWGATHPYCGFMGWHQNPQDAVQLNMLCRPCSVIGDKPCRFKDLFCLNGITPSLIISHIKDVLERNNKNG